MQICISWLTEKQNIFLRHRSVKLPPLQIDVVVPTDAVSNRVSKACPADCSQDRYSVAASYSQLSTSQKQTLQVQYFQFS